jgi:orotidine-5'-phosphate decarboxylase
MPKLVEILRESADRLGTISCFGNDPVRGDKTIPLPGTFFEAVDAYYAAIFAEMKKKGVFPGAYKPNQGFFVNQDRPLEGEFGGSKALAEMMKHCKSVRVPTILDFKRGDIAKSSANYAVEGFDAWKADAVTIHPYMGEDSVGPFFEKGGAYMMCRTSNKSAPNIQDLAVTGRMQVDPKSLAYVINPCDPMPVFMAVADWAIEWAKNPKYAGNVGVVVGATYPAELEMVANRFVNANVEVAILVPGIGAQGGNEHECMERLKSAGYDHRLARLSSSSELNFAWAKQGRKPEEWAAASVDALADMNNKINLRKYVA